MTKEDVKDLVREIIREELLLEALNIIDNLNEEELNKFGDIKDKYDGGSRGNIVCIEIDFCKTKLEYFGRIPKVKSNLGIDLDMIPDLVLKWVSELRDDKLNDLLTKSESLKD
jgi:hypothetical protein